VIAEARRIQAGSGAEPAGTRRVATRITAQNADAAGFDRLVADLRATRDPLAKRRLLEALSANNDPVLAGRVLDLIFGPDAPAGSVPSLLALMAVQHPELAWRYATAHIDAPGVPVDPSTRNQLMPQIASSSGELKRIDELKAYAAAKLEPVAAKQVEGAIGQIRLNARMRAEGLPQIDAWLKAR
jgi:aminopeptidase N